MVINTTHLTEGQYGAEISSNRCSQIGKEFVTVRIGMSDFNIFYTNANTANKNGSISNEPFGSVKLDKTMETIYDKDIGTNLTYIKSDEGLVMSRDSLDSLKDH